MARVFGPPPHRVAAPGGSGRTKANAPCAASSTPIPEICARPGASSSCVPWASASESSISSGSPYPPFGDVGVQAPYQTAANAATRSADRAGSGASGPDCGPAQSAGTWRRYRAQDRAKHDGHPAGASQAGHHAHLNPRSGGTAQRSRPAVDPHVAACPDAAARPIFDQHLASSASRALSIHDTIARTRLVALGSPTIAQFAIRTESRVDQPARTPKTFIRYAGWSSRRCSQNCAALRCSARSSIGQTSAVQRFGDHIVRTSPTVPSSRFERRILIALTCPSRMSTRMSRAM
jgi:hypothetical protein